MEITPHLSEAELVEFISDPSRGLGTHLEYCDSCLSEVARLRETVAALRTSGNKSEEFWNYQRAAIRNQIAAAPAQAAYGFQRLAWAPVFVVVILAGLLVSGGPSKPVPAPAKAVEDPDHALLIAVEEIMQSNGPEALEPATYFVQQIKQETHPNSRATSHKELRREN